MTNTTRREVLAGICALAAFTIVGCAPAEEDVSSAITDLGNGKVSVDLSKISSLGTDGSAVRLPNVQGFPAVLVRRDSKTYQAYSLQCPHNGYEVEIGSDPWRCPAHGAQFDPTSGEAVGGPTSSPLYEFTAVLENNAVIVG